MNPELSIFAEEEWLVSTDRARDAGNVFAFQSKVRPSRHCWIDCGMYAPQISVDLEDWDDDAEWDNSIYRVCVASERELFDLVKHWFQGEAMAAFWIGLNLKYGGVKRVRT